MKKRFKRILIPTVAVILLFSICTLTGCSLFEKKDGIDYKAERKAHEEFIEELGGVSDTYKGEVSDNVYTSTEDAANAYLREQVLGYNGYNNMTMSDGERLSLTEIASLNLSGEDAAGIISVEAYDVLVSGVDSMKAGNGAQFSNLATLNDEKIVKVYIIKYLSGYKYYAPCPVTGNTITKSYYDSVFNSERYQNCTYTMTSTVDEEIAVFGFLKFNIAVVTTQTIKYDDNGIYIEEKTEVSPKMFSDLMDMDSEIYAYITENEYGDIECYVSEDGDNYNRGDLYQIGFGSIKELTPFYDQYLDYTYFTKTDFGFEISEENAKQYVDESFSDLSAEGFEDSSIELLAKYYVCDGTLTGMRTEVFLDAAVSLEGAEGMEVKAHAVTEIKITDYGTTEVELPFDVDN